MRHSIAVARQVNETLVRQLVRSDGQEDLCFALWFPSRGSERATALVAEAILPEAGERHVHGNVSFEPTYFQRALQLAMDRDAGLAFLHSHPASGWQGMSPDDVRAEEGMAGAVSAATGLPLVGMTLAARDGTWSGRSWERNGGKRWCESVRVVGERLEVSYDERQMRTPRAATTQVRTVSAWGESAQAILARLHVGIVGLGSVGMQVAEALARMGVSRLRLLDFDSVNDVNLDRLLYATTKDVGRAKVDLAAEHLRRSATAHAFTVEPFELSVCEPEGFRRALDCDLLFSCVDRPWPRSVLNFIAYAHLVPVIDGGIRVSRVCGKRLRGADWKAHVSTHGLRCLLCRRQYDAALSAAEEQGYLDDPSYIDALSEDHPLRARQNVFAFSMATASLELMQMIMLVVSPSGIGASFAQNYHLVTGGIDVDAGLCDEGCVFQAIEALGELAGHSGVGRHVAAEQARAERRQIEPVGGLGENA